jgi:putative phage-type endonuclease
MIYHDVIQGTDEWLELRKGKFTASEFSNLFMTKTTAGYQNTIYKLVFEKLTNESPESFTNDWMKRGNELEAEAKEVYQFETLNKVLNGGFFELNDFVGASPDGLIGSEGLVEIKCPKYSTMINYLLKKELPNEYFWQVHGQMFVSERKYVDFMAYHPKLNPLILTIKRDEVVISQLEEKLFESIQQVKTIIEKLK